MNSRIGAAGASYADGLGKDRGERTFEALLDRVLPGLTLPAGIVGAVELYGELYAHGEDVRKAGTADER